MNSLQRICHNAPAGTARALYAPIQKGYASVNAVTTLQQWLLQNFPNDVVDSAGNPFKLTKKDIYIDGTANPLDLPVCEGPINLTANEMFSDKLLMVKVNSDLEKEYYSYSKLENLQLGITDIEAPDMMAIPLLSDDLMDKIRDPKQNVQYEFCTVKKENGAYQATIHLNIDGTSFQYTHEYQAGEEKML